MDKFVATCQQQSGEINLQEVCAVFALYSTGLEIERYDLPNQIFLAVQIPFTLSTYFLTCQKWWSLVCCRNECFHDKDLFLVLLSYTKLVYSTVLILDLSANIQIYLDSKDFYRAFQV